MSVCINVTWRGTGGKVFILESLKRCRELVVLMGLGGSDGVKGSSAGVKDARGLGRTVLGQSRLCTCSAFFTIELAIGGISAKLEKRRPICTVAEDAIDESRLWRPTLMDGGGFSVLKSSN
jgi:hypothetical protein